MPPIVPVSYLGSALDLTGMDSGIVWEHAGEATIDLDRDFLGVSISLIENPVVTALMLSKELSLEGLCRLNLLSGVEHFFSVERVTWNDYKHTYRNLQRNSRIFLQTIQLNHHQKLILASHFHIGLATIGRAKPSIKLLRGEGTRRSRSAVAQEATNHTPRPSSSTWRWYGGPRGIRLRTHKIHATTPADNQFIFLPISTTQEPEEGCWKECVLAKTTTEPKEASFIHYPWPWTQKVGQHVPTACTHITVNSSFEFCRSDIQLLTTRRRPWDTTIVQVWRTFQCFKH